MKHDIVLDLHNIRKVYGAGEASVVAVDTVDLDIEKGEIVLIMGPSGSGKTTLLSIAGGLLKPTQGSVLLNGEDLTLTEPDRLATIRLRHIGFVFQAFNLLSVLTARENVEIAMQLAGVPERDARARAVKLLSDLGMEKRLDFRPEKLAGGEKQRVSIARAMANDPAVILADEPTANLDSKRGHEVMRMLHDIAKKEGKTVVIVSHDERIRDIADRVLWLEDGRWVKRPSR